MKVILSILLGILLIAGAVSCNEDRCEAVEGPRVKRVIYISEVEELELDMVAEHQVKIDSVRQPQIEILAQEGVQPLIRAENQVGRLRIMLDGCIRENEPVLMNANYKDVARYELNSAGRIFSEALIKRSSLRFTNRGLGDIDFVIEADSVIGEIKSSGDLILAGACRRLDFLTTASGDLRAYNLVADTLVINVLGSSLCEVFTNGYLEVNFFSEGTVYYRGNPDSILVKGVGEVEARNEFE